MTLSDIVGKASSSVSVFSSDTVAEPAVCCGIELESGVEVVAGSGVPLSAIPGNSCGDGQLSFALSSESIGLRSGLNPKGLNGQHFGTRGLLALLEASPCSEVYIRRRLRSVNSSQLLRC